MGFFEAVDQSVAPLSNHLRHRAMRHGAIASNIANVDTPGYKAVDVTFKAALESATGRMAVTNRRHMEPAGFSAMMDVVELGGDARRDGNNVNIDHEMVKLAENQLEYRFLSRRLKAKFDKIKEAIIGRPLG